MVGKRKGMLHGEFFVGPNILFLTGDDYKRHRRLANLAFSGSMPLELFGQMTRKMFDWIDVNGKTEIYNLANKMTLDIIGKVAFGFDFNALDKNSSSFVDKYYSVMDSVTEQPFFFLLPFLERKFLWMFPRRKQAHQDLKDLLHLLNEIIEEKRKQVREQGASTLPDKDKDLLTLMLESEMGRSGVGLSNEELRSNMCAFFLAGHDSTAVSISAVVYYLALHQDIQRKAREEAIGVLGDDGKDTIPTMEQTKKFAYIDMIIKESLRLRPPVPMGVSRVAQEDCDIDGVFLPKGTLFQLDYWEIQHSPQVWKDPKAFRPERFAPGGEAEQQDGIAWLPFSAGPRACLGQNMSLNEQRVALPMLCK
ncbi:cytochrome P450 [Syncephalastrum racemosum]|uniref:Cytochrome P450 n=1 Tax=Syncephalastrum racemosum TaxID=13706 RepID=A0A1X2HML9_SYNRA|nr:cytochrome P450 [Syncephalastrum racemosum]